MGAPRLLIVGGGLTGLAAAREASALGLDWTLFEAGERLGGRVATDHVDGFAIDRGFQVLLTSYPSLAEHLGPLDLGRFDPGAWVRLKAGRKVRWVRAIDPWRRPLDLLEGGISFRHALPLADAIRLARLRRGIDRDDPRAADRDTRQYLSEVLGFSGTAMARFFVPFFGGVLLDRELTAPAAFMRRLFGYFSQGDAAIPRGGMGALPTRLASSLEPARLRVSTPVASVDAQGLTLFSGERHQGRVVVCTDPSAAAHLVGDPGLAPSGWHATTTAYYTCDGPLPRPLRAPLLALGVDSVIHHLAPLSTVQPSLAPEGRALISVSHDGVADASLEPRLTAELARWFPESPWRLVAVTPVSYALPRWQRAPEPFLRLAPGLHVAGDGVADRSIEGALASGRQAVRALAR